MSTIHYWLIHSMASRCCSVLYQRLYHFWLLLLYFFLWPKVHIGRTPYGKENVLKMPINRYNGCVAGCPLPPSNMNLVKLHFAVERERERAIAKAIEHETQNCCNRIRSHLANEVSLHHLYWFGCAFFIGSYSGMTPLQTHTIHVCVLQPGLGLGLDAI